MKMVRFQPEHCVEWGVTPEDKFIVDRVSPSGKSAFVHFRGRLVHISMSILIMEETPSLNPKYAHFQMCAANECYTMLTWNSDVIGTDPDFLARNGWKLNYGRWICDKHQTTPIMRPMQIKRWDQRGEEMDRNTPNYVPMAMSHDDSLRLQLKAQEIVRNYVESKLDKSDPEVKFQVFVVWFSKTLQNWKAMVSTTLPDQMYYEVTHNGDKNETYLDAYKKFENVVISG